jgi:hypothetical protein
LDQPTACLVSVPPGAQAALFHLPVDGAPVYTVLDRDGRVQTRTTSLGVAMTAVRHLVAEHGEAWVRTTDDTTAHIGPTGVASDTPAHPWIRTLTTTLETSP